jgi:hypothetical protein
MARRFELPQIFVAIKNAKHRTRTTNDVPFFQFRSSEGLCCDHFMAQAFSIVCDPHLFPRRGSTGPVCEHGEHIYALVIALLNRTYHVLTTFLSTPIDRGRRAD